METIFSEDQIENLRLWKRSLQTEIALGWKAEEDKAEEEIHLLLETKNFKKEGSFSNEDFDRIFQLGEGGSFAQHPCYCENKVYVGGLDRNIYCIDA